MEDFGARFSAGIDLWRSVIGKHEIGKIDEDGKDFLCYAPIITPFFST